jgi:alpha-beta hydrolase superfamily lysophospholipase
MPRRLDWKLVTAGVMAAGALAFLTVRAVAFRAVERQALISTPNSAETPSTYGAKFTRVTFPSGDRALDAVAVPAANDTGPVIVIFHGTAESVSSWADVQALFADHGIASFVFDYTGFGRSAGEPSAARCAEDARAAFAQARAQFGAHRRYYVMGYSLGTGILFDALPTLSPAPDGVMMVAGYSAARDGAMAFLRLPSWMKPLLPNMWDNVSAARALRLPLLVMHSRTDEKFPVWMPNAVFNAAAAPKQLVILDGPYTHDEGHRHPTATYWESVLAFATSGHVSVRVASAGMPAPAGN